LVNGVQGIIAGYGDNRTEYINALCGRDLELFIIKAGGMYSYHWALNS
jgi:hypothetical protein